MGAKSVIAVEANPENFAVLKNNIAPWPQIKGLNAAAADGVVKKVKIIEDKGISKTLPDAEGGVTAIGFGELVAMFPPDANDMFMKCDIEGGEYDFLLSARKADIIRFKTAILETHQVPHLEKLAARKSKFLLSYFELMGFEKVSECPICCWFHNTDGTVRDCVTLEDQGDAKMVRKD
jgi:FkbM family methyltransferase